MSKINIKTTLENNNQIHTYQGKAIKKDKEIIYIDKNIKTKIIMEDIITIERKSDYYIKLNLKKGIKTKGIYINKYGTFELEIQTSQIIKTNNEINITYKIKTNENEFDTFKYKLKIFT